MIERNDLPNITKSDYDNSYSLEWIFPNHRFSLSIDPISNEGSWHFVSNCDKMQQEYGMLDSDFNDLIYQFLENKDPKILE